ncbi:hypothetical protein AAG906_000163 [Vitis piasezkii]
MLYSMFNFTSQTLNAGLRLGPGLPGQAFQVKAPDQEKVINLIRCFDVLKNGDRWQILAANNLALANIIGLASRKQHRYLRKCTECEQYPYPLNGRKADLIKWEAICEDKSKGGLGLRKLVLLNKALLGKWIWRFAYDKDNLWKQVITAKYGQEGHGWRAKRAHGAFGGVWKEIWKETDWLSQNFPHLFAMASHRNATVEEMWDQNFGITSPLWRKIQSVGREEGMTNLGSKKLIDWWPDPMILFFLLDAFGWIQTNQGCILCLGGYMGRDGSFLIIVFYVVVKKKRKSYSYSFVWIFPNCKGDLN